MEDIHYPAEYIQTVVLSDGSSVALRPVLPDDTLRLQEAFNRLSAETIYMRFLSPLTELTDEHARQLTHIDYKQKMGLVGVVQEAGQERIVAFARYDMMPGAEVGLAEVGIVVRDDYQSRGLGTQVIRLLVKYAQEHGVKTLVGTVHILNERILHFVEQSGVPHTRKLLGEGAWEIRADLRRLQL